MKKIFLFLICLSLVKNIHAQELQWVINEVQDSSSVSTTLNYIVTTESIFDADGNILTVGRFLGEVDFDPTSGVDIRESKYAPSLTTYNLTGFVKKNDPQGNLIWAKIFQSNSYCAVNDITLDLSGNIYITGAFSGLLKSNLSNPLNSQSTITSDAFVMKLDTLGNVIWQKKYGGTDFSEKGAGIVCDTSGRVYVTGTYNTKYNFITGAQLSTAGKNRAFVLLLNQTSGFDTGFQGFGSTDLNQSSEADGLDIALDYPIGSTFPLIVLAGRFSGTADFRLDFGANGVADIRDAATGELFLLKFHGNPIDSAFFWARNFDEYDINGESGMEIDANNDIYFSNKERLFKFSREGIFQWENATLNGRIIDFAISGDGIIYTVGSYSWATHNFNGTLNAPQYICNYVGGEDGFIRKINTNGAFIWARTLGSTGIDKVNTILVADSSFYISGRFADTTDFALGNDTFNLLKPTNISIGAFLAKYEINENLVNSTSVDACNFYQVNGQTYYNSTTQTVIFNNYGAIDSVVVLDINIYDPSSANLTISACDSLVMNNQTFLSTGTYTQIIPNAAGCDSTITINLTINNSTIATVTQTACNSYTWPLSGATYTTSGTYTHVGTNAAGCPLTTTLNLTINNSTTATVTQTTCDSYTWPLSGTTYTTSGTYTHVGTNAAGCPLTTTLNLTINNATTASVTQTACDSYTWPLSGTTYTTSGTYTHVGTNAAGCDFTTTLNLTINNSTIATINESACNAYVWVLNGITYNNSGTYTYIGTNANGCPLSSTLNLIINDTIAVSVTENACDAFIWNLNATSYSASGIYTNVVTSPTGCLITTTLNLTINNSTMVTVNETACDTYTWGLNGSSYNASGTYTYLDTNAAGCPQTTTLNLVISTIDTATTFNGSTITANANGASYQWVDCNNGNTPISGATNQSYTPMMNGDYAVIVSQNGCSATSNCVTITNCWCK
jgi:hypothetical protein